MSLFSLAIDLSWNEEEERFLPFLYIVDITKKPLYIYKIANEETLKSVSKKLSKQEEDLITLVHDLKKENILKKLTKNKKIVSLKQLKEDKTLKNILQEYLNRKLNALISATIKLELPISINLYNNKDFYLHEVHFSETAIKPLLHFSKKEEGIEYTLSLLHKNKKIQPFENKIITINQLPCWVSIDRELVLITDIDGLKLKPFLKNKSIHIPKRMEKEYFKKFINDIIKKVTVETNGFSVITKSDIINYGLKGSHDFLGKKFFLQVEFDYQGTLFYSNQNKQQHSFIEFDNNDNVSVIQYKRDFSKEAKIEEKLTCLGFEKTRDGNFHLPSRTEELAVIEFVIEHFEELQSAGFDLSNFLIDHKKIQLKKSTISLQSAEQADWFDLKMTIFCGNHQFSFSDIIPNIRSGNQWFLLPDDSYFIIPITWLKTYGNLAQFGTKKTNGTISLPKSHYQNLDLNHINIENESETKQTILYKPSSLLKATLRPYQIQGVQWLLNHYANGLGACLADDMGLGKTLQTLALLIAVQENEKNFKALEINELDLFSQSEELQQEPLNALVVVPSSLVFNWYNETKKFAPHFKCIKYIGNERKLLTKRLDRYDLIFTSFAVLNRDIAHLEKIPFRYLIVDESQQIKNRNSKIFKALTNLNACNKISLSGTPIENSLADLWSQMQFINPSILGEYAFFDQYFKKPIEKNHTGNKIEELKNIINPYILRRTKSEVLKDLPELVEQVILCEMSEEQEKHYDEEKSKARNYLLKLEESESSSRIHILNVLLKLRQWSNHPKLTQNESTINSGKFDSVTSYLETLVKSKNKTLVFSSFVNHLALYERWCHENKIRYCTLTGNTAADEREHSVKQFQEDNDTLFFFISLKAGGVGLNLTKASYIIILDPWWNPFAEKQAIARAHRIGQENKVNVVRFITQNTIEEKILQLQEKKKELSESIIDESSIPEDIIENLDFILA